MLLKMTSTKYTCKDCGKQCGYLGCDDCHQEEISEHINQMIKEHWKATQKQNE